MKLPFFAPVVPPHVFCLQEDGVTYARVRRRPVPGFEEARHFRYPGASVGKETPEALPTLVTREAVAEAVKAARALAGGRLTRASVLFPDAWAKVLSVELEAPITADKAGTDMLLWKLKKLLPQTTGELALLHHAMPSLDGENRVLVVATPRQTIDAIERAFEEAGVRIGYLAPSSVALFEGLAPTHSPPMKFLNVSAIPRSYWPSAKATIASDTADENRPPPPAAITMTSRPLAGAR